MYIYVYIYTIATSKHASLKPRSFRTLEQLSFRISVANLFFRLIRCEYVTLFLHPVCVCVCVCVSVPYVTQTTFSSPRCRKVFVVADLYAKFAVAAWYAQSAKHESGKSWARPEHISCLRGTPRRGTVPELLDPGFLVSFEFNCVISYVPNSYSS